MDVPFAATPVVLDGLVDDWYGEVQTLEIYNPEGYEGPDDLEAFFRVCWDMNFFYVLCEVVDDVEHDYDWGVGNPWAFDNAQFYFQLDTNTVQTEYDETCAFLRVCRGLDSVEQAWNAPREDYGYYMDPNTATGWIFEVAIPWTATLPAGSLPEDIEDYINQAIGFDMEVGDSDNWDGDDAVGNRDVQTAWDLDDPDDPYDRTEDLAWMNTSVFGYVTLMMGPVNPPPVADAGPDQTVMENTEVDLDGTGSYDPEGENITYTWSAPAAITLSDIHSATPGFIAPDMPHDVNYTIQLVVSDSLQNSAPDYVIIEVIHQNVPPVADAGPDQTVNGLSLVRLDGTGSYDHDTNDPLYPSWISDSDIQMLDAESWGPTFVAPGAHENDTIQFYLTVSDGIANSDADTVNLFVTSLDEGYDTLVVYDTVYVVETVTYYNTLMISVVDSEGDLIAREEEGVLHIELYPNPTDQYVRISSEMLIEKIAVYDIGGTLLTEEEVNALSTELNLGGYTAGTYVLRIFSESGEVSKQFVLE